MVLESTAEETAKAIRLGILALMIPVITSHRGPLCSDHQVHPGRTRHLGQTADRILHLVGSRHHQVRQLVDNDNDLEVLQWC